MDTYTFALHLFFNECKLYTKTVLHWDLFSLMTAENHVQIWPCIYSGYIFSENLIEPTLKKNLNGRFRFIEHLNIFNKFFKVLQNSSIRISLGKLKPSGLVRLYLSETQAFWSLFVYTSVKLRSFNISYFKRLH